MNRKGASAAVGIGVFAVILILAGTLIYNHVCNKCLFEYPQLGGGGGAVAGAEEVTYVYWDRVALLITIIAIVILLPLLAWRKRRAAARAAPTAAPPAGGPTPPSGAWGGKKQISTYKTEIQIPPPTAPYTTITKDEQPLITKVPSIPHEWAKLLTGADLSEWFVYFNKKLSIKYHSGWKFHIYADNPTEVLNIGKAIIPVLKSLHTISKVVPTPQDINLLTGEQNGKAFTVYVFVVDKDITNIDNVREVARKIVRELDPILSREELRAKEHYKIPGDRLVSGTDSRRIFYTYELDKPRNEFPEPFNFNQYNASYTTREKQRKKDNKYNIENNPEIFP